MFRNVPACSGMFHVPGFIDALFGQDWVGLHNKKNECSVLFIVYFMDQSYIDSGLEAILC